MNLAEGFINLFFLNFSGFVESLNQESVIITWLSFLVFCLVVILIFLKLFGEIGMYIYTVVAVIGANIQVLKIIEFPFFPDSYRFGYNIICIYIFSYGYFSRILWN